MLSYRKRAGWLARPALALSLALSTFTGAAFAQVTIYGSVDQGIAKGNGGTAANAGASYSGLGTSEATLLRDGHGSRVGFRGNESLGDGLSAQFILEHRFTPDNGAAAATFWNGGSFVQLTSATVGSVYLGRWYTPAFWITFKVDPWGYDSVATPFTRSFAGFLSPVRTANTIGYKTPRLGGFTANIATGLGEGTSERNDGFNAEYTAGPIWLGVGYERYAGNVVPSIDRNRLLNLGFAYDFKVVRPTFYYAASKTGPGNVASNKLLQLALTAPVGPGVAKALWYRFDPEGDSNNQTRLGLGYDYFLSKRTRVYVDYALSKEDAPASVAVKPTDNRAYDIGVRHDF